MLASGRTPFGPTMQSRLPAGPGAAPVAARRGNHDFRTCRSDFCQRSSPDAVPLDSLQMDVHRGGTRPHGASLRREHLLVRPHPKGYRPRRPSSHPRGVQRRPSVLRSAVNRPSQKPRQRRENIAHGARTCKKLTSLPLRHGDTEKRPLVLKNSPPPRRLFSSGFVARVSPPAYSQLIPSRVATPALQSQQSRGLPLWRDRAYDLLAAAVYDRRGGVARASCPWPVMARMAMPHQTPVLPNFRRGRSAHAPSPQLTRPPRLS